MMTLTIVLPSSLTAGDAGMDRVERVFICSVIVGVMEE
jgi:hypothetical protein